MGEARRKKLALLRQKFLLPEPEPDVEIENLRADAREQLAAWFRKQYDDLMFKELTK